MQSHNTTPQTQTQDIPATLAAVGVEFTLPKRGEKRPFTKGWPQYRASINDVLSHLGAGHNLGVHVTGYSDGRLLSYFDGDDAAGMKQLLTVAPELRNSLLSWRKSGSGKAFFWVDGKLPQQATTDLDGAHSKREFKSSGQAVILGVHPSGERYNSNLAAPITLTAERVIQIWKAWTGQEWKTGKTTAHPGEYTRRDDSEVERIKSAWPPSKVFAHFRAGELVKDRGGEIRVKGQGGLLCNDAAGTWYSFSDETGGDAIAAWARCTRLDQERDFLAIVDQMADAAGIERLQRSAPDDDSADLTKPEIVTRYDAVRGFRQWTESAAALCTLRELSIEAWGTSRAALGMQKTLQAIAEQAVKHVTFRPPYVTTRKLSELTAQSAVAAAANLKRLAELGMIEVQELETGWKFQVAESLQYLQYDTGDTVNFQQPGFLAATLGDDLFAVGGAYVHAIARRTFPTALLRSAGPAARHILARLQDDMAMTGQELVKATGLSAGSVRGALSRLSELGLLDKERAEHGRYTYRMTDDAAARIETIRPHTTTYANTQRRMALYAGERAAQLGKLLSESITDDEIARIKAKIDAQMRKAADIKTWLDSAGILPARGWDFDAARVARMRTADRRRMQESIRLLAKDLVGMEYSDAKHMSQIAGWTVAEFSQAWAYSRVTA